MSDQGSDKDGQRRDALLRQLAKMPPLSRAEIAELARRAKAEKKASRIHTKKASGDKPAIPATR